MSDDMMRAALEAAIQNFENIYTQYHETFSPNIQEIYTSTIMNLENALKAEPEKRALPQSLVDMTQLQLMEYAARLENQIAEMQKLVDDDDETVTVVSTESVFSHAQPYEVTTDIGVKYSAKGECQPEASVKISRKLEDGNEISELIKADWSRGVEEVMAAIDEIKKRNAGVK